MVRKTVFTPADVVAAGVQVVEKEGLTGLSARRLAEELGSSTAPVYSNFANMDDLAVAVKESVTDQMLEFTTRHYTDAPFLNMGIGILEFARQKPTLYAAIFMQDADQCEAGPRVMSVLGERLGKLEEVGELPLTERLMLLHQMGNFTHGLAVQICTGLADHHSFEDLVLFLEDAGDGMMKHALSRPERTPEQLQLMQNLIEYNTKDEQAHD